jgi:hypothetical protein
MTPAAVLEAVNNSTRLIVPADLAVLFDVTPRTIVERAKDGRLPTPLSIRPYRWSAQQIARFLDAQGATA